MVGTDDFERDVALELAQCQGGMPLGIVVAELLGVAECGAGQQVQIAPIWVPINRSMWPPKCGSPAVARQS